MIYVDRGFTLIELMIVAMIIALIVAIAIPNLMRSRMSANEGATAGAMRVIFGAEIAFQAAGIDKTPGGISLFGDLNALGTSTPPFIDETLTTGFKQGYTFDAEPAMDGSMPIFTATGVPSQPGSTGIKSYYVDDSGTIHFEADGTEPTVESPAL